MLTSEQSRQYERERIVGALCAGCSKQLDADEVYACGECINEWLVYRDQNGDIANDDIQEQ
ncbi:protein NinF [Cronobacter turicensis]|uniref:protein NinF n=1 Tax=Cronobacter turicensis TaxID=413502 RepID=UPI001D61E3FB|nr:protein NinF [Cronobacter turicensis]EGT4490723.1 NinF family protein [Cronobacter turicensis]MDI6417489.1 protein NinF [Cronobacter turicensis]MDI6463986.1 protein NinF [Cronobacter turicensis]MDI7673249.1 protein NinF [Cronobacter turicensis]